VKASGDRIRYRKLPGRLRGVVRGASVWMGPDHLLAVRSTRFREEYKRFYLRDVQAIVVANTPRFHVSSRVILLAVLWLFTYLVVRTTAAWADLVFWTIAAVAVGVWLYISAAASCRCRIHTAVSREELPSIYRRYTARKFLAKVEPRIAETQGVLEGDWAQAVQQRAAAAPPSPVRAAPAPRGAPRTWATDLLIATLFASAILNAVLLRSTSRGLHWFTYGCNLVEVAAAAAIVVQHYRGKLRTSMQRLAIAALALMGVVFYLQPLTVGMVAGIDASRSGRVAPMETDELGGLRGSPVFRQIDIGASVLLGCVGLWILLRAEDEPV
jgi:hypothetical protein